MYTEQNTKKQPNKKRGGEETMKRAILIAIGTFILLANLNATCLAYTYEDTVFCTALVQENSQWQPSDVRTDHRFWTGEKIVFFTRLLGLEPGRYHIKWQWLNAAGTLVGSWTTPNPIVPDVVWDYAYAWCELNNALPGSYTLKVAVDSGTGFVVKDTQSFNVATTSLYQYDSTTMCADVVQINGDWTPRDIRSDRAFDFNDPKMVAFSKITNIYATFLQWKFTWKDSSGNIIKEVVNEALAPGSFWASASSWSEMQIADIEKKYIVQISIRTASDGEFAKVDEKTVQVVKERRKKVNMSPIYNLLLGD